MKLHLLDATYELFRAYHAIDSARAPDGREVAAVMGVVETTLSLLREPDVTHLAAATDHEIRSFRNRLWPGYKTEEGVPEDLLAQFPLAERALETIGVTVWAMVEFEADDALATAADRFQDQVEQTVICSPDKDLAQCVIGGRIVQRDRRRAITYDEDGVRQKFGVSPASIPDWLALVGDAADGYPGLPGWGAKSATAVLARWKHLDAIPQDHRRWDVAVRGADRLAATLQEKRADAQLFRRLATLRRDVPLAETLDDLRWRGVPREPWLALCEELGFTRTRERPHRWREAPLPSHEAR
ncbi:MAG TPA: 5'-3' exonuclease H3TH domain-containing protein [Candidatus Eisenbacteria bacterium]|nr:5'-3' exonuclease H3TH domain-containing protein [Candidatus Eisenbacteria bacterium]